MKSEEKKLPFNLLVTHVPGYGMRRETLLELHSYIDDLKLVFSDKNKLFLKVKEPKETVIHLCRSLPRRTTVLRAIPVDDVVRPNIESVIESVRRLIVKKGEGKIAVRVDGHLIDKRGSFIHRPEAAAMIGDSIDRDVNLDNPDILIYIKVTRFKNNYIAIVFVDDPRLIFSSAKRKCI